MPLPTNSRTSKADDRGGNRLLAAIPPDECARLRSLMEPVRPRLHDVLYEQNVPIRYVYFPDGGVFSLVTEMHDQSRVEIGTVGNEGMVGLPVFHGAHTTTDRAICQVTGPALRMPAEDFREIVTPEHPLHPVLHLYTQAFMVHLAQSVACNRLHSATQRFARWLLIAQDRVQRDEFAITQEFLAEMLGVRRTTVSGIAAAFRDDGVLRYHHGRMTIDDRAALEGAACECYGVVRQYFADTMGTPRG